MTAKVLMLNGSPHVHGCTYTALEEIAKELKVLGVESEIVQVRQDTPGCRDCKFCKRSGVCVIDDQVNDIASRLDEFDAVIFGSPVYYSGPSGQICAFADRLFYSAGNRMAGKLGSSIVSCRRGGASASFDRLNKYFTISNMPVVSSQYWNQVHGNTPSEVREDLEGMQTMRTLARNIAWLLCCIEAGDKNGVPRPEYEPWTPTNFIRGE